MPDLIDCLPDDILGLILTQITDIININKLRLLHKRIYGIANSSKTIFNKASIYLSKDQLNNLSNYDQFMMKIILHNCNNWKLSKSFKKLSPFSSNIIDLEITTKPNNYNFHIDVFCNLSVLSLYNFDDPDFSFLTKLYKLKQLTIFNCAAVEYINNCPQLEDIYISDCKNLKKIYPIKSLTVVEIHKTNIERLILDGVPKKVSIYESKLDHIIGIISFLKLNRCEVNTVNLTSIPRLFITHCTINKKHRNGIIR